MQVTPEQTRAARAMLGWNQSNLRIRAGIPYGPVKSAARPDEIECVSAADLDSIRRALETEAVQFIPLGVRRPPELTPEQQALFDGLRAISLASAAELRGHERLTDDDLYDEHGLPA